MPKTKRTPEKFHFVKEKLSTLRTRPKEDRRIVFDEHTAGLGLVVFPSGTRTFFHLKYVNSYPRRTTIGRFPDLSIEQARGKASELNSKFARWKMDGFAGESPLVKRQSPTLADLAAQYVEKHLRQHAARPGKAAEAVEWQIGKYLASWKNRKAGSIRKTDVVSLQEEIGEKHGKTTANRVLQTLRAIFNFAKDGELYAGENPATRVKLFHEEKRTRFLQPDELGKLFRALKKESNRDLCDFVNLALWTGARRGDVLSMRWVDVFLDNNRWEVPHPKSRRPYNVALTPEAVAILRNRRKRTKESQWVFPGSGETGHLVNLKSAWRKLLKRAKITGVRIHDLRRTLGSYQAAQGTSLQIIGKSLGHQSVQATQIYSQLNLDPIRESVMAATRAMLAAGKKKPRLLEASHG